MIDRHFLEDHPEFCRVSAFIAIGATAGAGLMYLLDPDRGARRRTTIRDKAAGKIHDAQKAIAHKGEDLANRTTGLVAEARAKLARKEVSDEKLAARVHTELGRLISKPRTVEAAAHQGVVTLRGWVPAQELAHLLEGVKHVAGVRRVESQIARA